MDSTKWGIVIFLVLAVVGIVRIAYIIARFSIRKSYTNKYLKKYNNWLKIEEGDSADKLYNWLMQNAGQIQSELGQTGVAEYYISPGATYALPDYQIIVNILPIVKVGVATEFEVNACKDALNKHIGNLKYARRGYLLALLNPFRWILEGAKIIITFPIYLFYWVGLYKYNKIVGVKDSKKFKIISAIITLISFLGLIMGIVVDWGNFWTIIKQIKK